MHKKFLHLATVAALSVLPLVAGSVIANAAPKIIKIAFNQAKTHSQVRMLEEASDKLEKATGGRYKFQVFPNETLGDQRATLELVQNGAIEMTLVANPILENYNKDFSILGLPYLYDTPEHQRKVFTSGVLSDLFKSLNSKNIDVLAAYTAGARNIYTNKAIKTPEDLKGYKIRVMQSETMIQIINLMGGVGTPMAQGEVYTAVQQGVIEGGENNESIYNDLKHYEVAPFYSYTRHLMVADLLVISKKFIDSMSAEDQKALREIIAESVPRGFELWDADMEKTIENAKKNGATFVEVDIKPFQERCLPLHEKATAASASAKKVYDAIRAIAQE